MEQAPNINDLRKEQVTQQKFPTIEVIGCGGAGINILKQYLTALQTTGRVLDEAVTYSAIDTSKSNLAGFPSGAEASVKITGIGELGSGKDRSKNLNAIFKFIENHQDLYKQAKDLTVLIFSMAGGSGSVIAPLLAHRIMRNSTKAVLLIGVIDSSSQQDCRNSIATLKTLSSLAERDKLYFPLLLLSNMKCGRIAVNKTAVARLHHFLDMMTARDTTEVDFSDKMNFMRPTSMGCASGVYLFSVLDDNAEEKDLPGEDSSIIEAGDLLHGALIVNDTGIVPNVLTMFNYVGISPTRNYFATIGKPIGRDIFDALNETQDRYLATEVTKETTKQDLKGGEETNTGIVL